MPTTWQKCSNSNKKKVGANPITPGDLSLEIERANFKEKVHHKLENKGQTGATENQKAPAAETDGRRNVPAIKHGCDL